MIAHPAQYPVVNQADAYWCGFKNASHGGFTFPQRCRHPFAVGFQLGVTLTQYVQFTDELFLGLSFVFHLCTLQVKKQGSRYRAQGKTKKENIFSPYALRLMPYALCLTPCALRLVPQASSSGKAIQL
jgi:hypothetical protein